MSIDYSNYFEIHSDKRGEISIITIYESGRIKVSKAIIDRLTNSKVSLYLSKDYKEILLDQCGDKVKLKKDGSISAKNLIENNIDKKKVVFPMVYDILWDEKDDIWRGILRVPTNPTKKTIKKKSKSELRDLI